MIKSKYKLIIFEEDFRAYPSGWIKSVIRDWVRDSGVKRLKSGVIFADADEKKGQLEYTALYDSYWWTGRGEPMVKDPQVSP